MKIQLTYLLAVFFLLFSCKEDSMLLPERTDFEVSETTVSFQSVASSKVLDVLHAGGQIQAKVISTETDWCTVTVSGSKVTVSAAENELVKSRNAKVEITAGNNKNTIMIRQSGKIFSSIAAVQELDATTGMGELTLSWKVPAQDNFSHVMVSYEKDGQVISKVLEPGVLTYRITGLRNIDGLYTFNVQSIDKEGDLGEIASIKKQVQKLVAFGFSNVEQKGFLPFHFRSGLNQRKSNVQITTNEYNANEAVTISMQVDQAVLDQYNQKNGTNHQLISASKVTMPANFVFTGTQSVENMELTVDYSDFEDRKSYALPIRIQSVSSGGINETNQTLILVYYVDDLAGWYTVERLASSGEGTGAYPKDEINRRRYIKRTGTWTWETGYLFGSYSKSETQVGSLNTIQYISMDPNTKQIKIQQGNYAVSDHQNSFDAVKNELLIKYLYRDWAGWWTHERMFNRSVSR